MKKRIFLLLSLSCMALISCGSGQTASSTASSSPASSSSSVHTTHVYDRGRIKKQATCTESGITIYTCTECGATKEEPIQPLGHDYGSLKEGTPATCLEDGLEDYYQCSRCEAYFDSSKQEKTYNELIIAHTGHQYTYYEEKKGNCQESGMLAHYECDHCHAFFNLEKQEVAKEDLMTTKSSHNYVLTEDGYHYECSVCKDQISSGKGEVDMRSLKQYLFLGSSICNGYDGSLPNPSLPESHYSMADMFGNDFLKLSYKYHNGKTFVTREDAYLRKVATPSDLAPGSIAGTYKWYDEEIVLDGAGRGEFLVLEQGKAIKTMSFSYSLKGSYLELVEPEGYLFSLFGHVYQGNPYYKHAADGYSLSTHEKYTSTGERINPNSNYVYLMKQAIAAHKKEKIDTFVFQLSTNDVGNYLTSEGASSGHIPFGQVSPDNVRSSSELDTEISLGALEWLIASAKETWNCNVILFTVHMSTGEYATYKANDYDVSAVKTAYADIYEGALKAVKKWGIGCIDMFASKEANIAIHEDAQRCLADSLHLHKEGYEKVYYPLFRAYCEKGGF